jgi:phosphoesterase RecJ-like protein
MMKLDDIFTKSIKTCAIVGHVSPDGDAVGSVTALYGYVQKNFPWIDAELYIERPKESLMFLPGLADAFFDTPEDSVRDLFVSCDVSSTDRFGVAGNLFPLAKKTFCVDHHISNPLFADINVVDADASSCAEVLYNLMDPAKIDLDIATSLYTGIIHDSGVFQYSNTRGETLRIAADLLERGVPASRIIDESFNQRTMRQSRILGKVLQESMLYVDGKVIVGSVTLDDMNTYEVTKKDLDGIVSELRLVKGVLAAVFIYETEPSVFKVSLRSNGDLDVSRAAGTFGGGGHIKAAGCTIQGTIPNVRRMLLDELAKYI